MKTNEGVPLPASVWNRLVAAVRSAEQQLADTNWVRTPDRYRLIQSELDTARRVLGDALTRAPWGASGAAFVTNGGASHPRALWINRRRVATVSENGWVEVDDPSTAELQFQMARRAAREREAENNRWLQEVAELLAASGIRELGWGTPLIHARVGYWIYYTGEKGGYFAHEKTHFTLSARGALRRAEAVTERVPAFGDGGVHKIPRRKSPWREE